jgi:hypothetical protein
MGGATSNQGSGCTHATSGRSIVTEPKCVSKRACGQSICTYSAWVMFVLGALQGCVYYDESDKCGPHMVYNKDAHVCFCDAQSVSVAGGCSPCAAGLVPMGGKCACPAGAQQDDAGACQAVAGLGDPCDAMHPCNGTVYSHCAISDGASGGTCTKTCAKDDDCDAAYTCADWESTPFCKIFKGVGTTCSIPGTSDPVCTADADYCFMGQCFVRNCAVTAGHAKDSCPRDRKCCDVSALAPGAATACVALDSQVCQ